QAEPGAEEDDQHGGRVAARKWGQTTFPPEKLSDPIFEVGATGFEPATTYTPSRCATRLRYAPKPTNPTRRLKHRQINAPCGCGRLQSGNRSVSVSRAVNAPEVAPAYG